MGYKVDSSFLRFLTMGALATRRTMHLMAHVGLEPIELERYSCSNKIWSTKVKRLRLPDLICCKTGVRVEVRAKSDLAIKMSDSPGNPARRWFSGLRADDLIAFLYASDHAGQILLSPTAELFRVEDLQACPEQETKLGPPKSASEGAERDREWPSTVPSSDGTVVEVSNSQIRTVWHGGRTQTYRLNGKVSYVKAGDKFSADIQFLAGLPKRKAGFPAPSSARWDPRPLLVAPSDVDRYAAVKVLGRTGLASDHPALLECSAGDADARVRLEAAGALARLGSTSGIELLKQAILSPAEPYLRMEAVLILSELSSHPLENMAADVLCDCATDPALTGSEIRQAAIWGLGKSGLKAYARLHQFLDCDDQLERMHAMHAFARNVPEIEIESLASDLQNAASSSLRRASAAFVLARVVDPNKAICHLLPIAAAGTADAQDWALGALGQIEPSTLEAEVSDPTIRARLKPFSLFAPTRNWTSGDDAQEMLGFLRKQVL